ncbi:hypothetical protein PoB_000641400 [Plakobranchus ocellatus]|uniref:Lipoprotein n=1 Tax=Plakobranchus ocellatus TaxID=259542 RepID=A0AAV3YCD0_9GAST|nr:hypothetical protein PoB_000641400 [Plakobranchus ocellatus]
MKKVLIVSFLLCLLLACASPFLKVFKDGSKDVGDALKGNSDSIKYIDVQALARSAGDVLQNSTRKLSDDEIFKIAKAIENGLTRTSESVIVDMRMIRYQLQDLYGCFRDSDIFKILDDAYRYITF